MRVLVFELSELPQLAYTQLGVIPFPRVERRVRNADVPAHISNWRSVFSQSQRIRDLLFRKPRLPHRLLFLAPLLALRSDRNSSYVLYGFPGETSVSGQVCPWRNSPNLDSVCSWPISVSGSL